MSRTISSGEPVHDVVDAEAQLRRIDEHRAEMDAREEGFQKVMEIGERMIDNGHFAADEVSVSFDFFLASFMKKETRWLSGPCAEVLDRDLAESLRCILGQDTFSASVSEV